MSLIKQRSPGSHSCKILFFANFCYGQDDGVARVGQAELDYWIQGFKGKVGHDSEHRPYEWKMLWWSLSVTGLV